MGMTQNPFARTREVRSTEVSMKLKKLQHKYFFLCHLFWKEKLEATWTIIVVVMSTSMAPLGDAHEWENK